MIEVRKLIQGRAGFYVTEKVMEFIRGWSTIKHGEPFNPVAEKIKFIVECEFNNVAILESEYGKTKRLLLQKQFRIVGFFDGRDFIAIDWYEKKKQKLSRSQQERCKEIDGIRERKAWRRV